MKLDLLLLLDVIGGVTGTREYPGTPGAGSAAVQTITINGSPDGGTWRLSYQGVSTASMANNESLANVQAKLNALPGIGAGGVVVTGTPGSSYVITWQYPRLVPLLVLALNLLTNGGVAVADPTIANTTPGVTPTPAGVAKGGIVSDTTTGMQWTNIGTATVPSWQKIGAQS